MIQYGRSTRWFNDYGDEISFSKDNGFDFMQVWYANGNVRLDKVKEPKERVIKEYGFPVVFHALLDINEFEKSIPDIFRILKYLGHKELIIHPVCKSEPIGSATIFKLADKIAYAESVLSDEGITVFVENNSKLDPIHYRTEEIGIMFKKNPKTELLLDIAHIDSYEHLREIVKIKKPKMLHIADKHFDVIHEHLPLGDGEIDYKYVFEEVLQDFDGKIIFEVVGEDAEIINSKRTIKDIIIGLLNNQRSILR